MSIRNSLIGSPIERLEDLRFLRGRGEYVDDVVRPGLLHAAILRSPVAHGRIRKIDTGAALALPGVHAVLTAADFGCRSEDSAAAGAAAGIPSLRAAGHCRGSGALCRRTGRGRDRGQRRHRGGCA